MSYIYQVTAYLGNRIVYSESDIHKEEEATERALDLKYKGGIDRIVLEKLTEGYKCHSKKVWLWQACGRWDNGTYYYVGEDNGAKAESSLTLKYRRV